MKHLMRVYVVLRRHHKREGANVQLSQSQYERVGHAFKGDAGHLAVKKHRTPPALR